MEHTLIIIKPDIIQRNLIGNIISIIENQLSNIHAMYMTHLSKNQAKTLYYEHSNKSFFNQLISYITSDKVILITLKKNNIIKMCRQIIGNTDPTKAAKNTIRNLYGINIEKNSIHSSNNQYNAKKEIKLFFNKIYN